MSTLTLLSMVLFPSMYPLVISWTINAWLEALQVSRPGWYKTFEHKKIPNMISPSSWRPYLFDSFFGNFWHSCFFSQPRWSRVWVDAAFSKIGQKFLKEWRLKSEKIEVVTLTEKNSEVSGEGGAGVVFDPSPYGIGLSKIDLFGDFACRDFACLYKIRNKKSREQHQQSNKALIYSFEARTLKKKQKTVAC